LYISKRNLINSIKSRRMRWIRQVAPMSEMRSKYDFITGTPERKKPLGRRRWEYIKKYIIETVFDMNWINLAQDRIPWTGLVNALLILRVA
jgi:hypothetical protein